MPRLRQPAKFAAVARSQDPPESPVGGRKAFLNPMPGGTSIKCGGVDGLTAKLKTHGVETKMDDPAPWKRFFFLRDPFGNRIEIHGAAGLRA